MSMEQGGGLSPDRIIPLRRSRRRSCWRTLSAMLKDYYCQRGSGQARSRTRCWPFCGTGAYPWHRAPPPAPVSHVTRALERLGLLPYFEGHLHHRRAGRQQAPSRISITWRRKLGHARRTQTLVFGGLALCPANRQGGGLPHRGRIRRQRRGGPADPPPDGGRVRPLSGLPSRPLGGAERLTCS